jgi:hypothetical protein
MTAILLAGAAIAVTRALSRNNHTAESHMPSGRSKEAKLRMSPGQCCCCTIPMIIQMNQHHHTQEHTRLEPFAAWRPCSYIRIQLLLA